MAALDEDEQAEAAGALGTVWPPPPTCAPVEAAPSRRSLLPVYLALPQMPKGFGLPGWAFSAFINGAVVVIALDLRHHAPFAGKVVVGVFTALHGMLLLTLLFWAARALGRLLAHIVNKAPLELPSFASPDYNMSVTGGWLGFIPATALWIWGQFYLFGDVTYRVSLAVFAVQVAWLAMGCVVAIVNGVSQWLRERRAPTETETGS